MRDIDTSTDTIEYDTLIYENTDEYEHDVVLWFTVSKKWVKNWFDINCKGIETNGNIAKDFYETLDDFNNDYTWDDTHDMYVTAIEDGEVISERKEIAR